MNTAYIPLITPSRPDNPTPLELAIYLYEKSCASFHNNKNAIAPKNETQQQLNKRIEARDQDWKHLQLRKISISAQAKLEEGLAEYRAESMSKSKIELQLEKHHPTDKLVDNLEAIGEVKPSVKHEPHHIVMGKGQYLISEMMRSRLALHSYGIGINDSINGVWLANYKKDSEEWRIPESSKEDPRHWATPDSPTHRPMHGKNYELWITRTLRLNLSEKVFMTHLRNIKLKLRSGSFPKEILQSFDPSWSGKA